MWSFPLLSLPFPSWYYKYYRHKLKKNKIIGTEAQLADNASVASPSAVATKLIRDLGASSGSTMFIMYFEMSVMTENLALNLIPYFLKEH